MRNFYEPSFPASGLSFVIAVSVAACSSSGAPAKAAASTESIAAPSAADLRAGTGTGALPEVSESELRDAEGVAFAIDYLPFNWLPDRCETRAFYLGAELLMARGLAANIVWASSIGSALTPKTVLPARLPFAYSPDGTSWIYHAALNLRVRANDGGAAKEMVIDPSFATHAIPVEEWVASLGQTMDSATLRYTPFTDASPGLPRVSDSRTADVKKFPRWNEYAMKYACGGMLGRLRASQDWPPPWTSTERARGEQYSQELLKHSVAIAQFLRDNKLMNALDPKDKDDAFDEDKCLDAEGIENNSLQSVRTMKGPVNLPVPLYAARTAESAATE